MPPAVGTPRAAVREADRPPSPPPPGRSYSSWCRSSLQDQDLLSTKILLPPEQRSPATSAPLDNLCQARRPTRRGTRRAVERRVRTPPAAAPRSTPPQRGRLQGTGVRCPLAARQQSGHRAGG